MTLQTIAEKYGDYQIEMRRYFHKHPEVSGKEYDTCKKIREELDKIGVPWVHCGMETGTLATIKGNKPGKTILLRGDIDALTVLEETGAEYASVNEGIMHACGHDCHISMLLTAAHILNDMKDELCGTVKLAFQPAEEIGKGAMAMIAEGALEGVEGCFGIHVWTDVPSGHICCMPGPMMASADQFFVDIKGKGGHGAAPHQCIDAAVVASAVVNNLQTVVSRNINPGDPAVVTVGVMSVGSRWNVVPENAHLEGTTRCFSKEAWNYIPEKMEEVIDYTAKAFGAEAKLDYVRLLLPTINTPEMASLVQASSKKIFGEDAPFTMKELTMGAEDFSCYVDEVPGALAFLGTGNPECGAVYANHNGHFCVDEDMLIKGAMLYAQVALDFNRK